MNLLLLLSAILIVLFTPYIKCEKYYENLDQLRHELNQFISAEHRQQLNGYDILEVIKVGISKTM